MKNIFNVLFFMLAIYFEEITWGIQKAVVITLDLNWKKVFMIIRRR